MNEFHAGRYGYRESIARLSQFNQRYKEMQDEKADRSNARPVRQKK